MSHHSLQSWLAYWPAQLTLLALAVIAVYGHTLDVPFYLDDFSSIRENPLIYQWQGFGALWTFAPMRFIGYLSLALNYYLDQFAPIGYHLVNILIHFLAGSALYWLARALLQTSAMHNRNAGVARNAGVVPPFAMAWLPLVVALIFVLHPLQVQAVTYIVQRIASLAAFFYLAALAAYVQGRLAQQRNPEHGRSSTAGWLWLSAALVLGILALFTKQNTATLPLALLLVEFVFLTRDAKHLARIAAIAVLAGVLLWAVLAFGLHYHPFSLQAMEAATKETTEISRATYLATQMPVLWVYIRLFLLPKGLHIDHDFPVAEGFFNAPVLLALFGHLLLMGGALFLLRRQPWVAFGILFYYLAHLVESSVIPIRDVLFEHRTYLPNAGFALVFGWLLTVPLRQAAGTRIATSVLAAVLIALAVVTWQRNQLWRDPIALWQNNAQLAPNKSRAWSILGKHTLQQASQLEGEARLATAKLAEEQLKRAVALQQARDGSDQINTNDAINLILAMKIQKRYDEALATTEELLRNPSIVPELRAKFLINRGNIFYETRRGAEAEASYREALRLSPSNISARANLASILGASGRLAEAEAMYLEVLRLDPDNQVIQQNLTAVRAMIQSRQ